MDHKTLVSHEITSPFGPLLLIASEEGLLRIAFEEDFSSIAQGAERRYSTSLLPGATELAGVERQLEEYFQGERKNFTFPLDLAATTPFRAQVHRYLTTIPYGQTRSYKEVAQGISNPGAVRAVGSACGANPLPIVVPCHRVVASGDRLGGYAGGARIKTTLLHIEGRLP